MANHFYIHKDTEEMSRAAAGFFVEIAKKSIAERGRFVISLSGGSTPENLFKLLAKEPWSKQVDWKNVHVFWGDERCVPADSPESNYRMANEALLSLVPIPEEQIYAVDGEMPPRVAAAMYDMVLRDFFETENPVFDLVLLGLGDDGHTASLFPGTSVLDEKERWAKEVFVEKMDSWRVTLTAPIIEAAAHTAFLVAGEKKAEVLTKVLFGAYMPDILPSQMIVKNAAEVYWFLDEKAALNIQNK